MEVAKRDWLCALSRLNLFTGGRHTKGKYWLILLGLLALTIPLHGYWYASSVIDKYIQRCGA